MRGRGPRWSQRSCSVALIGWALIVTAGYHVGKSKGRATAGLTLTILLGLVGLVILACLPKTQAVKAAEAQRQLPYPPQYPYPPVPVPAPEPSTRPKPSTRRQDRTRPAPVPAAGRVPAPAAVPAARTVPAPAAGPMGPASLMTPGWRSR